MRVELVDVTGDGDKLAFTVQGRGAVVLQLRPRLCAQGLYVWPAPSSKLDIAIKCDSSNSEAVLTFAEAGSHSFNLSVRSITTASPTSRAPSAAPTVQSPTATAQPSTISPSLGTGSPTAQPTTAQPTTAQPTTAQPTTASPTPNPTGAPTTSSPTTSAPSTISPSAGSSVSGTEDKDISVGSTAPASSTPLVGPLLGTLGVCALVATVYGVRRYSATNPADDDGDVVVRQWDGGAPSGSPDSNRFSTSILPTFRRSENATRIESRYSAFFVDNPMYSVSNPIVKRFSVLRNSYNGSPQPVVPLNV
jgi:hypothetical protein